ncbi:glycerol-3-phosphate dehydrogenase/oxidase [Actinokineospora spheciospongiae]|uniref:glycerol-3-phosphate dehydrogenase/oxidase n=1 Tax=Actinokineospora spheciospongiae TaxID=909613 RepID=UPI000D712BEC|nr:glycerol-3-phosphate dehydrogenase/oxidase [Actinokineospora spheciospongiae]PWW65682.1 glycerol-3-phosphate dehydrogenase [Actinokineospora spheciospongiae]
MPEPRTALNAARRAADLAALAGGEVVDLLVVGGGVTGAGVALDAAARGLSVALLEAQDLAHGTSRWSSKLVHGGLRYLAKGDVGLVRESAVERGVLMTTTAPHLTRALPQLIPLHRPTTGRDAALTLSGLLAGDALRRSAGTPSALLPRPRRVSAPEALALVPGLRRDGLRGGLLSFDGQLVDDARLVVALARTAAGLGARVLTRARVTALTGTGAAVTDALTDSPFEVRARAVVNATGVWAGTLVDEVTLRPSRGTHLVLDARAAGLTGSALMVPISLGRYALLLPQPDGRAYLGLTDEPVDGPIPDVPTVPQSDVDLLLDVAGSALATPLRRADVLGSFAGLRPLLPATGRSADLSRHHAVLTSRGGVITVVGGKLTTYRRMAADAVDRAIAHAGLNAGPSTTATLPLVGAAPRTVLSTLDAPGHLVERYGTEAPVVHALGELDPDLAAPIAHRTTAAEVVWAVRNEGALTAADVLERRTRLALVPADAEAAAPAVTSLVDRALAGLTSAV